MYDSFSEGPIYLGRVVVALVAAIALAYLLQLL
jgi:hypothetical protein